jgi:multiple sugar transport system substrate-binding protein
MKKLFSALLIIVFVFGLVMTAAAEKIELRIAWWGGQNRHDRTIKVIEMFEKEHPDIDIIYEFSTWDDHWTKLATQAAGGNLPDIMQHDYARISEWVANGLLLPLDDYVAEGILDFSDVAESTLEGGRIGGKLYGVNLGTNSMCFVLNVDLFQKAGIDLPPQQWTWADFEKLCLALHEKLGLFGYAGNTLIHDHLWKAIYLSKGEWVYSADGKSLGYTDDQPLIDHLKMIQRLQKAGAIDSRGNELAYQDVAEQQPFNKKQAAMNFMWSNQVVGIQSQFCPDCNFKLVLVPRLAGGKSANYVKPSMFFSITKDAKHPKEAAMFINYFTNSVEANTVLLAERGVPISSVVKEGLKPLMQPIQIETFDFLGKVETDSVPIPPPDPVGHADVRNNVFYPEFVDPVLYGQISPEEGAATFRKLANEVLSKE